VAAPAPAPAPVPEPDQSAPPESTRREPAPAPKAVAHAARSFSPLFVLAAAVLIFLGVHSRLDRRDPKLARASVDTDSVEFR
ncbi:MAG: hypothetical protein ACRDZ1_11360, partial [Acidimicrobiia bacterium]